MMQRGVISAYLSLIFLLMLSMVLALLESSRCYVIGTMAERYADMAAEMVFASYVRPLADRYDLLVVDGSEDGEGIGSFEHYLRLNLEQGERKSRLFNLHGQILKTAVDEKLSVEDNDFEALRGQIESYEKYALGAQGIQSIKDLITQAKEAANKDYLFDYSGELRSKGEAAEQAEIESEVNESEENQTETTAQTLESDPRPGITRWIKSGLLNIVMGDKAISNKAMDVSSCSWQTAKSRKPKMLDAFEHYAAVVSNLSGDNILNQMSNGVKEQGNELLVNAYLLEKFQRLGGNQKVNAQESVLQYELEYILSGGDTDRENLEDCMTSIFVLRTLLNLMYLYTSPQKGEILQQAVEALSILCATPIGQVVKLLLMACWAAAEAVVDCASLADHGKVPLRKDDSSWNLSIQQLTMIGKSGGKAADFVRDGNHGLDYGQYLFILLLLTPSETKFIRMTQVMEQNIRLVEGYEQFSFSNCAAKAQFSGIIEIRPQFVGYFGSMERKFRVQYSYID